VRQPSAPWLVVWAICRLGYRLDMSLHLMEVAASSSALATLALDIHLEREGKDNHARAMLETAYWLQSRSLSSSSCGRAWRSEGSASGRCSGPGASAICLPAHGRPALGL